LFNLKTLGFLLFYFAVLECLELLSFLNYLGNGFKTTMLFKTMPELFQANSSLEHLEPLDFPLNPFSSISRENKGI
jgi:hypothetical protein